MPCRWLVPSANAASAATTGVSSLAADRSRSTPCRWSVPRTVSPRSSKLASAPKAVRMSRIASPGWSVDPGQCGTVTAPPVTAAAARNGAALDRSGSIVSSCGAIGPGCDPPAVGLVVLDPDVPLAEHADGHLDVRPGGDGRTGVAQVEPAGQAGADHQQGTDELAGPRGIDGDRPRRRPGRPPVNGQPVRGPRSTVAPRAASASSSGAIGRAYACSSPSKCTGPSASRASGGQEAHHRAGQAAVDAAPAGERRRGDDLPLVTVLE